ncbi:MAG: hypothetical protein LBH90_00605 [Tannerella sp.]|jgi:hypothetical protein|nr:hypothetical protein [Tannerella sp.]
MEEYIQEFDKGKIRLRHPEARVLKGRKMTVTENLKKETDEAKRTELQKEIREIEKKRVLIPYGVEVDTSRHNSIITALRRKRNRLSPPNWIKNDPALAHLLQQGE